MSAGLARGGDAQPATPPRRSRALRLGSLTLGGGAPIVVQSMTNTRTADRAATAAQIAALAAAGCELVRVAVPDAEAAAALPALVGASPVPLVADIHFDHTLALAAIDAGVPGVRINPGNIGSATKVKAVARSAAAAGVVLRVGANAGSLAKRYAGLPVPRALVESALAELRTLEELGCTSLKVSLKSSDASELIAANRLFATLRDYPLHLGLTEAGTARAGAIRSAAALAPLLLAGLGDTIRISLAADPLLEVRAAWDLLRCLGLREGGVEVIACPTCSRTHGPVIAAAERLEQRLVDARSPRTVRVAVMGCEVNGPGEARHADLGVAFGASQSVLFVRGQIVERGGAEAMERALHAALDRLLIDSV